MKFISLTAYIFFLFDFSIVIKKYIISRFDTFIALKGSSKSTSSLIPSSSFIKKSVFRGSIVLNILSYRYFFTIAKVSAVTRQSSHIPVLHVLTNSDEILDYAY